MELQYPEFYRNRERRSKTQPVPRVIARTRLQGRHFGTSVSRIRRVIPVSGTYPGDRLQNRSNPRRPVARQPSHRRLRRDSDETSRYRPILFESKGNIVWLHKVTAIAGEIWPRPHTGNVLYSKRCATLRQKKTNQMHKQTINCIPSQVLNTSLSLKKEMEEHYVN